MLRDLQRITLVLAASLIVISAVFAQTDEERFRFDDIPSAVEPFEDFSFTLVALDGAGEVDTSYVGEVHFYTDTDDNAIFPEDYTFTLDDAGEKTFSGFSFFTEEGTHELKVVDLDDEALEATHEMTVAVGADSSFESTSLSVLSPTSGTSTSNVITFSGTTDPGLEVRIFDDGEILALVDADSNGDFSYDSPVLPDGEYTFSVETDFDVSSDIVVTINTAGAKISSVAFDPTELGPGDTAIVTVNLEEESESVSVVLNSVKTDLIQTDTLGRVFSAQVVMPSSAGDYPLNVVVDGSTIDNVVSVSVSDPFSLGNDDDSGITFFVPSQVQSVDASVADRQVNLTWTPSTDNGSIDHYAIFYGTDPASLTVRVDTNDAGTSWYIPNLINEQTYYFQVFGVDNEGNLGDQGSIVLSAVPGVEGSTSLHGASTDQVQVDQTSGTGPAGVVFLFVSSLFLGYLLTRKRRYL